MTDFPTDTHVWTDVTDDETVIDDNHQNSAHHEIIAIEEYLFELQSAARGYLSGATQAIGSGSNTKVTLDAESYDKHGEFDPTTNYRFTAANAGKYLVNARVQWNQVTVNKNYYMYLFKNGVYIGYDFYYPTVAVAFVQIYQNIVELAANDYLELYVYQDSGVARNIGGGEKITLMSVHRLS